LAFPGFFEAGGLPLARSSHPGRASKGFLVLYSPASKTEAGSGIPTSDLLSSCTQAESKEISKDHGRILFFIFKTKTRRKKRTYSYKEKTFKNIIFLLENRRCFS
jgi:hypothetical protein